MPLQTIVHQVDFCVIGGGLSGLCAAVAAARGGAKTLLMHERPMLGGNASSEIRMWVCGAYGTGNRETGILEEIMMENLYRNPDRSYAIWDSVLYEKAISEKNLTLLLNCSCMDADMENQKIASVRGWQMSTQTFHLVRAALFADCSGDSILAPLTGAAVRTGREAKSEFGESFGPDEPDKKTMGLSCAMQAVEGTRENVFIPPAFAEKITEEQLKHRAPNMDDLSENFWYLELGGDGDSIADTEKRRDELLALNYGMWDYIKNAPANREKNKRWSLDFVGMLPGKRESRRYVGAYTLTATDVQADRVFPDEIAYGGWTMDDHDPAGFRTSAPPNTHYPAPSPFGIPYRCLYARDIENLLFAGRNISVTHAAMSATRVMATCALLGQAAGTAAALCVRYGCLPRDISVDHMDELQEILQFNDCFLPHILRRLSLAMTGARLSASAGDPLPLIDGTDRQREGNEHAWTANIGDSATLTFDRATAIHGVRIVFDSELDRRITTTDGQKSRVNMLCNRLNSIVPARVPGGMTRAFRVTAITPTGAKTLAETSNHYMRLYLLPCDETVLSVTLTLLETWGGGAASVFDFEVF